MMIALIAFASLMQQVLSYQKVQDKSIYYGFNDYQDRCTAIAVGKLL
jgi:hypothetical protein